MTTLEQVKALAEHGLKAVGLAAVGVTQEEDHVSLAAGVVTISPATVATVTVGGPRWTEGWEVLWWTTTAGGPGYYDPPDCQDKQLYLGINLYDAVKTAVMSFHEDRLANALEDYALALEHGGSP